MVKMATPIASDTDSLDVRKWEKDNPDWETGRTVPDEQEGSKPAKDDRMAEVPPRVGTSVSDRAKAMAERVRQAGRAPSKAVGPSKANLRTSKVATSRTPLDRLIGRGWRLLAQMAQPINPPVSRVLDVQAPVAGMILEGIAKDTLVDRILQPLARVEQGGEVVFALIGPPLIVGAITAKPEIAGPLIPLLKEALRTWIDVAGPHLEKAKKQEEEFEEKYGQKIDEMITWFLAPLVEKMQTNEQPSN